MTEFERKLAALSPAAVDRDAVLFAAGRAAAPSRWPWVVACGLLVVTQVVTCGLWLGERRGSPPPAEPVVLPSGPIESPPQPPDPSSYLVLLRTWDDRSPPPGPDGGDEPRRSPPLTAGSRSF